jgi:hypothetical protein
LREARTWHRPGRRWGRWAARWVVLLLCTQAVALFAGYQAGWRDDWHYRRAGLQARLAADGKKHLVLVRHGPGNNYHQSWVWNGADIEGAPVVWAVDRGEGRNQELVDHFREYQVHGFDPDSGEISSLSGSGD